MKKMTLLLTFIFLLPTLIITGDFVTIVDPIASVHETVNGNPVIIYGTSSQPNTEINLFVNGTQITSTISDRYGNWRASYPLCNGTYTLIASLTSSYLVTLAQQTVTFTVDNGNVITINTPITGNIVFTNSFILSGAASFANTTVNIFLDNTLIATTSTNSSGVWQASCAISSNGNHTLRADLVNEYEDTLVSASLNVIAMIPIIFPTAKTQVTVIAGVIPTSGSGSGAGYTYTISGSIATINFTPAFNATPSVIATGLRSAGSSTVTATSITPTAANIAFSTGTQYINFTAALFS